MSKRPQINAYLRTRLLLLTVVGALLMGLFPSSASTQSNVIVGRAFTGVALSVDATNGLLTVSSKKAFFQLVVNDSTVINNPINQGVTLEDLPVGTNFDIAGLVDKPITDDAGDTTPELLTALKIMVIPEFATRKHTRTIAANKEGDDVTTLNEDGTKTNVPGQGVGIEIGDSVIALVQRSGREGFDDTVRALFKAKTVDDRLLLLAKAAADDPPKAAAVTALRDQRDAAQQQRLQKTADNAGTTFSEFALDNVKAFKENVEARKNGIEIEETISECSADATDCPEPATKPVVDEFPADETPPVVEITTPSTGTAVVANDVVTVTADATDNVGVVSVTFNVAGTDLTPLTGAPYTVDVTVPTGFASVQIKATAIDANGNVGSDAIALSVARATDVGVKITSPVASATATAPGKANVRRSTISGSSESVAEGDTINIRAEATGTGTITQGTRPGIVARLVNWLF